MSIRCFNIFFIKFLFFAFSAFAGSDFTGKQFICSKLLWGFEFISFDKVNVFSNDINRQTSVKQYYFEQSSDLPFINLYANQENRRIIFSIHVQTFRVYIWTMTSGGNTTREIIPEGFCEEVQVNNMLYYIESLKK